MFAATMQPEGFFEEAQHTSVRTDDGAELSVWSSGSSDREAVLLVHGYSLDHTTWGPVAERLVTAGYQIIVPDLRGHGRSTLGTSPPTPERFIADLGVITTHLGLSAPHLVGHSLGAVIGLAARVDDQTPFRSVTSIAGTEQSIQNPVMLIGARLFSSPPGVWLLGRRRTGRLMISTWFGKKPAAHQLDWIRTLSAQCARETRVAIGEATGDLDLRPTFGQAGPPTFVMCGRYDKATPPKFSQNIADAIAGAELTVIEDAGHMVIIEQPQAVADQLVAGFNGLS